MANHKKQPAEQPEKKPEPKLAPPPEIGDGPTDEPLQPDGPTTIPDALPVADENDGAESITVEVAPPKPSEESPYWIGLHGDCPLDNVTVGGFAFCKRTQGLESVDGRDNMLSPSRQMLGGVVLMTPKQLRVVKDRMAKAGIKREVKQRKATNGIIDLSAKDGYTRTEVVNARSPRHEGDDPLAWWAFIKPVAEGFRPDLGVGIPPPLAKRPS